jgi:hypothetical protein
MQKNPSTVYRMRGRPGPLRFVVDGRRIYVELKSVEAFVSHQLPSEAVLDAKDVETAPPERLDECSPALDQQNQGNDSQNRNEEHADMSGRSGQRALILPRKQQRLAIFYAF